MADAKESFTVEVTATGSESAAASLESLKAQLVADTAALRDLRLAMGNLKAGGAGAGDAANQLKAQMASLKQNIATSQSSFLQLGGKLDGTFAKSLRDTGEGARGGATNMRAMFSAVGAGAGPMDGLLGRARLAARALGAGGVAAGALLAVVAVAALTVAIGIAIVKTAEWAIGLADVARNARLVEQGVEASSPALKGLGATFDKLHASTGESIADLQKMGEELVKAGVKGAALPNALRALATATAGGATADYLAKLKTQLEAGGAAARKAGADVQASFGGIVAQKMLSLDAQSTRLHENISNLFNGLKIEGLLQGIAKIVALFDSTTSSGKAIKFLFNSLFQPLINGAVAAIPSVIAFMKQVVIVALEVYIAFLKFSKSDTFKTLVAGLKVLAVVIGVVLAISLALSAIFIGVLVAGVLAVVAVAGLIVDAFEAIPDAFNSVEAAVVSFFDSLDLGSIGVNMINGIVDGITSAGGAILSALTGIVGGAIDGVKSLLGIHSPSKVFAEMGMNTSAGMAQGIDDGADDVASSAGGLAKSAVAGASGGPSASAKKSGGGNTYNITINGVKDAEQLKTPSFLAQLAEAIEIEALMGGSMAKAS